METQEHCSLPNTAVTRTTSTYHMSSQSPNVFFSNKFSTRKEQIRRREVPDQAPWVQVSLNESHSINASPWQGYTTIVGQKGSNI